MKTPLHTGALFKLSGRGSAALCCFVLVSVILCTASPAANSVPTLPPADAPQPIYSADPNDSWNRIFFLLFTRRFQMNVSDEFPEAAPFVEFPREGALHGVSTRLFETLEVGDRAINPLYYPPPDSREGRRRMYVDPIYSEFIHALQDALNDNAQRTTIARALMQNDLWSAYDILFEPLFPEDRSEETGARKRLTLDLLAKLIRKIALSPEEIKTLPDNYAMIRIRNSLPDLFDDDSGWLEIEWFAGRQHDAEAGYRRFTRVFLKPSQPPHDSQKFLDGLAASPEAASLQLDGLALVIQLILIDRRGNLTPTRLTTDAQVRLFPKRYATPGKPTEIRAAQLSRRMMVADPASGGLVAETENSPTYFGGVPSDVPQFSGSPGETRSALQVRLRTRCVSCHGDDLREIHTFGIAHPPHFLPPPVRVLNPRAADAAEFSLSTQRKSTSFRALHEYFEARSSGIVPGLPPSNAAYGIPRASNR